MKIVIAYDGSPCSDAALDDLYKAGMPEENVEAAVISVTEVWLPPKPRNKTLSEYAIELQTRPQPFKSYRTNARAVTEAETLAKHAQKRLQQMFPRWQIKAEATYGSPAWEILSKAAEMKTDLIVIGSHGRNGIGRFLLGSISQKVVTEARCSVRVARGRVEVDPVPSRVLIGYDGSPGANAAVEQVASRNWRECSDIKLIAVTDPVTPSAIGRFVPPVADWAKEAGADEREWLENLTQKQLKKLRAAGLTTDLSIEAGNPKQILVEEAERWHADSIFVGANGSGTRLEMFLLGSVASAVTARAHCSVEVVRKKAAIQETVDDEHN